MALPSLSPEQRSAALAKAAEARRVRAEAKEQLKAGQLDLADLLARGDGEEVIGKLKVSEMLASLPGVGPVRAAAAMQRLGISPSRRLRGLGARQRAGLVAEFPHRHR